MPPVLRSQVEVTRLLNSNNPTIRSISEYRGCRSEGQFECLECKHVWSAQWRRIIQGATKCPRCVSVRLGGKNKKTHQVYCEELALVDPSIQPLEKYVNSYTAILHRHECGHEWRLMPLNSLRGRGCPKCKLRLRTVKLGARKVNVRGYEAIALKWLVRNKKVKPSEIQTHNEKTVPNFLYHHRGRRTYFPDFYIPKTNCIVEVKSLSTVGILGNFFNLKPRTLFSLTQAKAKAVLNAGYRFRLLIMGSDGNRIPTPKGWLRMTHKEFCASIGPEHTSKH